MILFADSSALVASYVAEARRDPLPANAVVVVSQLARVEVPAAFWRKHRMGEVSAESAQTLTREFEADYFGTEDQAERWTAVAVTSDVLDAAARLVAAHSLRAYDAVQLASALAAMAAEPACASFAAYDTALRDAAAAQGFDVLPGQT